MTQPTYFNLAATLEYMNGDTKVMLWKNTTNSGSI
jgi:hypothetical protein